MRGMSKTPGEGKEGLGSCQAATQAIDGESEASESALAISDAIFAGFTELARAIDRFTDAMNGNPEEERDSLQYLDGTKI